MAHNCTRVQNGHQVCNVHMLTKEGLRYRFKKQLQDVITIEELVGWKELMDATMLPSDSKIPLDDQPQAVIDRVAKGGVST